MKLILTCLLCAILILQATAQPPHSFKYQGIARNASGNPVSSHPITLRISLHQGTSTGTIYFREVYFTSTNEFGGFSINIGTGTPANGSAPLSAIPWGQSDFFQEVELDTAGGTNFISMGTAQLLSVPYALFAGNGGFSHYQVFDASDTFRVPSGISRVMLEVWGAGGGGGGGGGGGSNGASLGGTGGGGGGGGYVKELQGVSYGQAIAVTIGHGGSGGTGGGSGGIGQSGGPGSGGSNGGFSSFNTTTAFGGTGGNGGFGGTTSPGINGQGGNGGAGGNAPGSLSIVGQFGYNGQYGGFGGNAGGGGGFGGNPGGDKRAGGAGSGGVGQPGNGNPGSVGGDGRVIVWW